MTGSLLLLLPISVLMAALIGAAFWWAIFAGQFDESGKAGRSILLDDDSTDAAPARQLRADGHPVMQDRHAPHSGDASAPDAGRDRPGQDSFSD